MKKKIFELEFYGRKLIVETGEMAKQADGAVVIRYGDTVILSTTVASKKANLLSDFFPLTVLYQEKFYSVGKIPGGFIKREARPSDVATLTARMIDRPMRPLFPENFKNEVQIINTVLSVEQDNAPEVTALVGSSLAVSISKIPFDGPVAAVKIGRVDGKLIVNPTVEECEKSDLDLIVAGTDKAVNMVESNSKELSEDDMLEAIMLGHTAVKKLVKFQKEIIAEVGEEKMEYEFLEISKELIKDVEKDAYDEMDKALRIKEKLKKYEAISELKERVIAKYQEDNDEVLQVAALEELLKKVKLILEDIEYRCFRNIVVKEKTRLDGRKMNEIRDLSMGIDLLPRTHGSALFTRGETQSLSVTTLGALNEHQILDGLGLEDGKRFMLHYNFPQFSVGETGRYGAPGRREIGHGALGEKAILQVMPDEIEFPYTIRVVSEILESNGSSSQASICAASLSLMAAGVPLKSPVAGIAMGLIADGKDYTILTDIAGLEDHLGDMDFKVAGTKKGICALQMDIKMQAGVTEKMLKEALAQAKKARLEILKAMDKVIDKPREEVSQYAPKTEVFTINPMKIKDVIGKGGEMITKIILEASNVNDVNSVGAVKVDLQDDGTVIIYHHDQEIIDKTAKMIKETIREVETGEVYPARVVKVEDFGCFVELWPGTEGLVHISQLAHERVENTKDVVAMGDEILVKSLGYDNRGRLNLSRKEALPKTEKKSKSNAKK